MYVLNERSQGITLHLAQFRKGCLTLVENNIFKLILCARILLMHVKALCNFQICQDCQNTSLECKWHPWHVGMF